MTPGDYIRAKLSERGLAQRDLAFILGVTDAAVHQIIAGKRGVSGDMAKALATVFGDTPESILRLQKEAELAADLARAKEPDPRVRRRAKLLAEFPVREMVKRGWVRADAAGLEEDMQPLLLATEERAPVAHAAKKSDYSDTTGAQVAWLYRVRQLASRMTTPHYSRDALVAALPGLRALMGDPKHAADVPRVLSECGVRYLVVECLPGAKIDGACMWLDGGKSPVIGMSLRYDRIDNFWFVLRHEIEHVLSCDGLEGGLVDVDIESAHPDKLPECERLANEAASKFCVPDHEIDEWMKKAPFFSEKDLLRIAGELRVHPGIVAGQLRRRANNYRIFSKHLAKIRSVVAPAAVADGWGYAISNSWGAKMA